MANDKTRLHQGAHARTAYECSCGKIVHGNGARASHRAAHERRGEFVTLRRYNPYNAAKP
jgi:hypothetical protein